MGQGSFLCRRSRPHCTTNPSAICVRRRWPSRVVVGVELPLPTTVADFPCCALFMSRACCHHYPAGSPAAYRARFTGDGDLPRCYGGSAPTLTISRPARCSLTLRPARSAGPLQGSFLEVLQAIRRLLTRPSASGWSESLPAGFYRGEQCTLARHTYQHCRAAVAQPEVRGRVHQSRWLGCGGAPRHRRLLSFYNEGRLHQALGYRTPRAVFDGEAHEPVDNASALNGCALAHRLVRTELKRELTHVE